MCGVLEILWRGALMVVCIVSRRVLLIISVWWLMVGLLGVLVDGGCDRLGSTGRYLGVIDCIMRCLLGLNTW